MSSEGEDDVQSMSDVELEALRSIYLNDLEVIHDDGCPIITIQLYPSTADNVDEQYVRMSLILCLPVEYPSVIPDIQIKNSRGLSDEKLQRIMDDLFAKAEERKGTTMLFELIECAKDHLTAGNRPSCQCAICLYGFTEDDVFTKTKCYHYFHSHCLSRYVAHQLKEFEATQPVQNSEGGESEREICCPVCRVSISFFIPDDSDFPPPTSAVDDNFTVTEELKQLQNKMADLYKKQKDKGGIIDVEAEKNKFLLEISSVSSETQPVLEAERPNTVQNCPSEDVHCDSGEQRKENVILPRNKSYNQTQNSISRSKHGSNWYQKNSRRSKDSNYTSDRNYGARYNKHQEMKKSYVDEEHSTQCSIQEHENENCTYAKSTSIDGDEELRKNKVQKNDGTQKVGYVPPDSRNDYEETPTDPFSCDATEMLTTNNTVEDNQNKCHYTDRTQYRPGYHKRYQNSNHRGGFYKQSVNGNEGKHFHITRGPSFGRDNNLSNRRRGNYQHPRRENSYHQMRTSGSYNKKIQSEENCLKQYGKSSDHDGNRQPDEFTSRPKQQNYNYNKSRQNFHRRHGSNSRFDHYDADRKEFSRYCDTRRTDRRDLKDYNIRESSPVQNIQDSLDQVTIGDSSHQHSKTYGRINRRNDYSSRKTNKLQHGHHRYENKYDDGPRNSTSSYTEHHSPSHLVQESSASRNSGDNNSAMEAHISPDRYPKHPFRRQDGKIPDEAHRSNFSPVKRHDSVSTVHESHDVSTPVVDSSNNTPVVDSSNNSENYSSVVDRCSPNEVEKSNLAIRNADTNHSASRPPPGFAKKVVYGLPSVKPPPGFSQS